MALTAEGTSAAPVTMIMGIRTPWASSISCRPKPLSPGIKTSSTMHLGPAGASR